MRLPSRAPKWLRRVVLWVAIPLSLVLLTYGGVLSVRHLKNRRVVADADKIVERFLKEMGTGAVLNQHYSTAAAPSHAAKRLDDLKKLGRMEALMGSGFTRYGMVIIPRLYMEREARYSNGSMRVFITVFGSRSADPPSVTDIKLHDDPPLGYSLEITLRHHGF